MRLSIQRQHMLHIQTRTELTIQCRVHAGPEVHLEEKDFNMIEDCRKKMMKEAK